MNRVRLARPDLPPGHPGSPDAIRKVLAEKPAHWLAYYEGRFANAEGGPMNFRPQQLTHDNIREINAQGSCDERADRRGVRPRHRARSRPRAADDTDVIFTTDHGELQGDFGLVYKGPFHVDALMRLPLIWRPAPSSGRGHPGSSHASRWSRLISPPRSAPSPASPERTGCRARRCPTADGCGRQRVLCEWDSQFPGYGMHLRSIYRDGWCSRVYEKSTAGQPNGLEKTWGDAVLTPTSIQYEGTEGELYNVHEDPHQWHNRWDDPALRALRADLTADLREHLPEQTRKLEVEAPA